MQTVQYSHTGKLILIECEVRIPVKEKICIIRDTGKNDSRYFIAKCRESQVLLEATEFDILGVEDGTVEGLVRAIQRAMRM